MTEITTQINQVLNSNFGEELNSSDWRRLGELGSRLGADLAITESVALVLRSVM